MLRAGASWDRLAGTGTAARGSLLLAMLVMMTIASIVLAVAATDWSFVVRREKERELIFRGVQIARAIEEWQQSAGKAPPTSLEQLTKPPRPTLRKAYADPMTALYDDEGELLEGTGEWAYIGPGSETAVPPGPPGASGSAPASGSAARPSTSRGDGTPRITAILGVQSTSEELSIGTYHDAPPETAYVEWKFRVLGLNEGANRQVGGFEIPRPPGFGGLRLPGRPPVQQLRTGPGSPPGGIRPPVNGNAP